MLVWALANNCPIDQRLIFAAAENGHVNVVRWAREVVAHPARSVRFRREQSSR